MSDVIEVRLLDYPLDLYLRAQEHADELLREFVLISGSQQASPSEVPARLLAIVEELTHEYSRLVETPRIERDAAIERGASTVDLTYLVPPQMLPAMRHLSRVLQEADDFCRAGQHLLTLATPPDVVAFQNWFLHEFERQAAGEPPRPWPGAVAPH